MIFLRGIRYPDMVSILNFMYNGEVNVNQEDLQNFLAAAEELRIKGLSQASSESMPKKSGAARPSSDTAVPPAKRPRPDSPSSPISTPQSAKSPAGPEEDEEMAEPPQLSVKREFNMNKPHAAVPKERNSIGGGLESDEDGDQGNNILDSLIQAQNFALQQGFEQNMQSMQQQQHQMMSSSSTNTVNHGAGADGKNLLQFLGQNNVSNAAANALMMQRLLGTGYELHPLGSRKDDDPFSHIKVARSSKGWHCPQCIHISSTKGNLKSHILSGRHKTYTEKPFGCQYCDRSYGTKQSLQVHISTNHRAERDAEYQALSKSLGMKTFPEAQFYMKQGNAGRNGSWGETDHSENYESVMSPAALQQLQHQLQQAQVSQGHSQMNHQGQQQAQQVAATLASLSSQPSLTIQPTKGPMGDLARGVELLGNRGTDREKENLPSCRLEASGQNNKQEPQYAAVEESEEEDEEPQLSINTMDTNNIVAAAAADNNVSSITTP